MIGVRIADPAWTAALPDAARQARRAARRGGAGGHLAILLAGDAQVAELNRRFRAMEGPTNVLAFPAPANPEGHMGDIALAFGVCAREAQAQGKPLAHHLAHLVVHGVLHLRGYDHQQEDEARCMERLERDLLEDLGIGDPYAAPDPGPAVRSGHVQRQP